MFLAEGMAWAKAWRRGIGLVPLSSGGTDDGKGQSTQDTWVRQGRDLMSALAGGTQPGAMEWGDAQGWSVWTLGGPPR